MVFMVVGMVSTEAEFKEIKYIADIVIISQKISLLGHQAKILMSGGVVSSDDLIKGIEMDKESCKE